MVISKKEYTKEEKKNIELEGTIGLIIRVNVYFYLEDDSVHVSEPKTPNSGIPQGTLIRRHRIPKADSLNGQHYIVSDFNVGNQITLYSRTIKLVGCDQFTRVIER